MARTKKDPKSELPIEESISQTAGGAELPQTDPESGGEPGAGTLPDMELAAATSLDPDAPQTAADLAMGLGEASQTDSESPLGQAETAVPPEEPGSEPVAEPDTSLTDSKIAPELEDGINLSQVLEGEPGPLHTDMESGPDLGYSAQPAAEDSALPQTDPKLAPKGQATESAPEENGAAPQTDSGQPQKLRMPGRRGPRVVSIDAERTVETDVDKLRNDLLDLAESLKSGKILTGTVQGIEQPPESPDISYAVIYHGDFKVIIPALEMVEEPEDYRGQPKGAVLYYLLNKRQGAEVDYIVKGIDQQSGLVAASRLDAMAAKRREYYFRTDREGNYRIYEGIRAEARVVSVIRAGIFVDLFGAECYIPLRELSYQRWVDATAHYQPGQRVLVKVLEVDRSDRSKLRVGASVKQASENPYEKALKKYSVGNRYVGTVSMVDTTGVFVSLDGGIDCLCTYPKRGRPPRGCRVTVRILGINKESNRIWGVITHMSTAR